MAAYKIFERPEASNTDMPLRNTQTKLQALQALRGIAALLVVIYHVAIMTQFAQSENPWVAAIRYDLRTFGRMGVTIFFVLSGFVITYAVFSKKTQLGASDFLLKRITRIYPPYLFYSLIALSLYLASTLLVNGEPVDWAYLAKSFFLIPTYDSDGKFYPLLMVGWTLIFEMYFYLLFFLALCAKLNYAQTVVFYLVAFYLGGVIAATLVADDDVYAHVYASYNLWFFFCGALLFGVYQSPFIHGRFFRVATVLCILTGVVLVYMRFKTPIYRHMSFLLFAVSCVAFALTEFANRGMARKIAGRLEILGDASYTLYLYHSLAIIVISAVWKRGLLVPPVVESVVGFLFQLALLVSALTLISIPLYRLIERPLTNADNYRRLKRWIHRAIFNRKPLAQSSS